MSVATKPSLSPEARKIVHRALAVMTRRPGTVDMRTWVHHNRRIKGRAPYCGTVACIAGHIALAAGAPPEPNFPITALSPTCQRAVLDWRTTPGNISDTSPAELGYALLGPQASDVFHEMSWPDSFIKRYRSAPTQKKRVAVVVARVRHWLRTGE